MLARSGVPLGVATVLALTAVGAAAPAPRTCDRLTGEKVIETATAKIVARASHTYPNVPKGTTGTEFVGRAYYGCGLPRGRVHKLGTAGRLYFYTPGHRPPRSGEFGVRHAAFSHPAGRYVLGHFSERSESNSIRYGNVINLVTGRSYTYWSFEEDSGFQETGPLSDSAAPVAVRLSKAGMLAGIYGGRTRKGTPVHTVEAFLPDGRRKALDEADADAIPAASLRLHGNVVSWTRAGKAMSVRVTAATPARAPGTRSV